MCIHTKACTHTHRQNHAHTHMKACTHIKACRHTHKNMKACTHTDTQKYAHTQTHMKTNTHKLPSTQINRKGILNLNHLEGKHSGTELSVCCYAAHKPEIHSIRGKAQRTDGESPRAPGASMNPSEEILRRQPEINSAWSVIGKLLSDC